ncbi:MULTISPECIES: hydantoinase B/oxoprolinase family protein [unclassified Synechocystis]|uniref:hydantoinase B/oxoprolinase family protein n=1 Tax=unclassified Synechocystis TaxID=2640012 RepID=UPI0003F6110C|nr:MULTISPECIES: hydantoinase B/oxoprolinase family protein [unclassified Synechocystis]AIE73503.1 5-oxoprolinase [Synechocystis sp. PCC 6714]MCT0254147.1 hydantoinase B/oxoprolinase family protein [Synechocystis sp. CS-94]
MTKFFVDRGGTFTDIVAITKDKKLAQRCTEDGRFSVFALPSTETVILFKLLSENPELYGDAVIHGIRTILGLEPWQSIPREKVSLIKMGTTVATNALLERKGDRVVLVMTQGFRDGLAIAYQHRPDIFALEIKKPSLLHCQVIEALERIDAQGRILQSLDREKINHDLQQAYDQGIRSVAIALMHSYRYPDHELIVAEIAEKIGFTQISCSSEVSPLIKYIYRGDTTVVDAYLSPLLRRYVDQVQGQLPGVTVQFMQSHGGLVDGKHFQGRDSILSGPAGGIVGAVKTSQRAGLNNIITFDMGGTSTDVAHFNGTYERLWETEIAGVRLRVPSLAIHTVAAGGGSILQFDGQRYQVGPDSAGANPGPACYRRGGPLTVTDANVMVGRLQKNYFPPVFGPEGNQPLDIDIVKEKFSDLATRIGSLTQLKSSPEEVADGFLTIAVENMANAIKKISLQRGYDLESYILCCFGGAGGQLVCRLGDRLGISKIFLHPYSGVLSAYGMGLAEQRALRAMTIEQPLTEVNLENLLTNYQSLEAQLTVTFAENEHNGNQEKKSNQIPAIIRQIDLKYQGTDTSLSFDFCQNLVHLTTQFTEQHQQRYGFSQPGQSLTIAAISVEYIQALDLPLEPCLPPLTAPAQAVEMVNFYGDRQWHTMPVYQRHHLAPQQVIIGPAMIVEGTGTIVIDPGWQAQLGQASPGQPQPCHLVLEKVVNKMENALRLINEKDEFVVNVNTDSYGDSNGNPVDPMRLEIFKNLYQFIAEEMGIVLQNTASSVNIKERLDFSCAIFDSQGDLVANAPHIPVHLGSMGESVKALLRDRRQQLEAGDVYLSNNPYNGGTHLPDVTVITPLFDLTGQEILFYVASRGHQADLGGITPGSMPPHSQNINQEGILFDNQLLVKAGKLQTEAVRAHLLNSPYPARNVEQNLADFSAQIAANQRGIMGLENMVAQYGLNTVQQYMLHVQNNAEQAVTQAISELKSGQFVTEMDNGIRIAVAITVNSSQGTATIDFSGTSPQGDHNFNTPKAVVQAVVLYVFRTLVREPIPLNAGCLKPLKIIIPPGCLLDPQYPAAVVAGNVETSQAIADTLYGALGCLAASQGTMNNLTFGNGQYQYYETIAGGSGAGPTFAGCDAVQTHMTNSRLTDPEILESRFPVLLEQFAIRPHSGGVGKFSGGKGIVRQFQFLQPLSVAILSNRQRVAPFGLAGGEPGAVGENWLLRRSGDELRLEGCAQVDVTPGDRLIIKTPGGGGYGHRD